MSSSVGDLLLGGGLTLAGTVITQLTVLAVGRSDRSERRAGVAREHRRTSLEAATAAASDYRAALVEYNRELIAGGPTTLTEQTQQAARAAFQASVYRVDSEPQKALLLWRDVAQAWAGGVGSAADENSRWERAMRACGDATRETY